MQALPHLCKRGNVYQWRRRSHRLSTGIVDLKLSLGTTDLGVAHILSRRISAESDIVRGKIERDQITAEEARKFLGHGLAAVVAQVSGAIALRGDVATYEAAKATLLSIGKSVDGLKAPEFYPLRLLRGAIEQIEIIGAAIAILVGYRAAASERGRQTLSLILTRPLRNWQFVAGKMLAGFGLLAAGLAIVLGGLAVVLHLTSGVGLVGDDLVRIGIVWAVAVVYTGCFFLLGFVLTLHMKQTSHALLAAFVVWLLLVLIAPQIGDTLDPDNQVAGGVFAQLHIAKPDQTEIMKRFASFESARNGIEVASVTKHFERFTFAILGIKATYAGMAIGPILTEMLGNLVWILLTALGLGSLALVLPINPNRLAKT